MHAHHHGPRTESRRSAFTIIELVIVVGIMIILMGFVLPTLMDVLSLRGKTQTRVEIAEMDGVLTTKFLGEFKQYPPSMITLYENEADYPTFMSQMEEDSRAFIHKMFPALPTPWVGIDWNGNGIVDTAPVTLYGDQCLVFFLGGIPLPQGAGGPAVQGFSTNPQNPAAAGGPRRLPLFNFHSARLIDRFGNGFYSYLDAHGKQSLAYFSAYNAPNGYDRYAASDCPGLGFAGKELHPYAEGPGRFLNPNSFQIISAGRDGNFGLGSNPTLTPVPYWTAATAGAMFSMLPANERSVYRDDQANFSPGLLQAGP